MIHSVTFFEDEVIFKEFGIVKDFFKYGLEDKLDLLGFTLFLYASKDT